MIMDANPYKDLEAHGDLQRVLGKSEAPTDDEIASIVRGHLKFAEAMGVSLTRGARILDFGCGVGASVGALLDLGFDAYGVDVVELWGSDFEQYWHQRDRPPESLRQRLFKVDAENYRLPFDDGTFDFSFSDQVLEHVFNYETVFAELARVAKPGSFSVHRFPGPNSPVEAHIDVPLVPLCNQKWYLALWALLGRRSVRQQGFSWRETVRSNLDMMRYCNYPTKGQLQAAASTANVRIEFRDADGIRFRGHGRAHDWLNRAERFGLGRVAPFLLSLPAQRYMLIFAR